jgi:hypothetical protein
MTSMGTRRYPFYAGREKYRGPPQKCEGCAEPARFVVSYQTSWFRSDDAEYLVCEPHAEMARFDLKGFLVLVSQREAHMRQMIEAQHEETGRRWSGERRALPPRYLELPVPSEEPKHE